MTHTYGQDFSPVLVGTGKKQGLAQATLDERTVQDRSKDLSVRAAEGRERDRRHVT
jgi:hypothetical protein